MTEAERAQQWRINRGFSQAQLAELIGWTKESISLFERGVGSRGQPVTAWRWRRYKLACAGLEAQLATKREFNW